MRFVLTAILLILNLTAVFAVERPGTVIDSYFEGTDYELHVYNIHGRRDGKTLFIVGGIQGDEPGGYISADFYANLQLEQGNIILIPRANLKSVLMFDRGPEGDMNRLFTDTVEDNESDKMDEKVAKILMQYIGKSDVFLNLHDGWGFYSPKYISAERNPNRFGQSIIVDESVYECSDGTKLELEETAQKVLTAVNAKIPKKDHQLAFFNTNTSNPESPYPNMKKTATWYALRKHCVPSFGIESSKNLKSLEDKVLYHNYAVNEFMRVFDIIPENPPVYIKPPVFNEATLLINGITVKVKNNSTVLLDKNSKIAVIDIDTNHTRGIFCDILGHGNYNDFGKEVVITHDTKIKFRKDYKEFASVNLKIDGIPETNRTPVITNADYTYIISIDGKEIRVNNGDRFTVSKGSKIKFTGFVSGQRAINLPINLKGWVPPSSPRSTDDRGYTITVDDSFMKNFSVNKDGKMYPVVVENINKKEIARIFMVIE